MKSGIELIAEERKRQIEIEGWTVEHDAEHISEELATVGALYALPHKHRPYKYDGDHAPFIFPWDVEWWKPTPKYRIKELQKAGALIAAEIDRIQNL